MGSTWQFIEMTADEAEATSAPKLLQDAVPVQLLGDPKSELAEGERYRYLYLVRVAE